MDVEIDRIRTALFAEKETFQPIVAVVGPLSAIESSYVIINTIKYKTESCLAAFQLVLKTYFALDCEYPASSRQLWYFLQEAGLDIAVFGKKRSKALKYLLGLVNRKFSSS